MARIRWLGVLRSGVATARVVFENGLILAVAAPAEARAVLSAFDADPALADQQWQLHRVSDRVEILVTGVGKANAAGAIASVVSRERHVSVVSIGVAGALPGGEVSIGDLVVAQRSVYADEGVLTPEGFSDCEAMGFALGPKTSGGAIEHDAKTVAALAQHADHVGVIATVSTCSGTDVGAQAVVERTGAIAEAMEGAALGQVASRLGLVSAEVRAISNTTGDRDRQIWDLAAGLASVSRFVAGAFVR
jgi:futalosine hydrolase